MERLIFAPVVAAPGGEIDAAVGEQIERRPLLGDANGMMQRRHRHRGREPDARRIGGDVGQHQVRAGQYAERIEMMLADPGRMHAELVGVKRLGGDVGDELVGGAIVVFVVVVAQREITELHVRPPTNYIFIATAGRIDDNASVVNAIIKAGFARWRSTLTGSISAITCPISSTGSAPSSPSSLAPTPWHVMA